MLNSKIQSTQAPRRIPRSAFEFEKVFENLGASLANRRWCIGRTVGANMAAFIIDLYTFWWATSLMGAEWNENFIAISVRKRQDTPVDKSPVEKGAWEKLERSLREAFDGIS